ncbi:MAG: thiamine pyrophosphate-binding protein [Burkholderiaceae bacterium]
MDAVSTTDRRDDARYRALLALRRSARRSGAQRLAAAAVRAGITHAFVVGGNPVDPIIGACGKAGIRLIGAHHQGSACLMSLAFNYVSGAPRSIVIVSPGPAASNCMTAVLFAHDNNWPLLVIAGRYPSSATRPGAFQDFDAGAFSEPLLRARAAVSQPEHLEPAFERMLAACHATKPGAVWIDVTREAVNGVPVAEAAKASGQHAEVHTWTAPAPPAWSDERLAGDVDAIADQLVRAQRPVLLFGHDLRWSEPWPQLRRLVDTMRMPFAATPLARGYLPQTHPLDVTMRRAAALANADLVLLVGARIDWTIRHGAEFPPGVPLIRIGRSAVGDSGVGIPGDEATVLSALIDAIDARRSSGQDWQRDEHWLEGLRSATDWGMNVNPPARDGPGAHASAANHPGGGGSPVMATDDWLAELADALPDDAITVLDGNVTMTRAQRRLAALSPVSRLTPGRNGTMGVGVSFAIGAQLARSDRPVVLITGDFAFALSAVELETAVRHRVPIVVVVANNRGAGGAMRQRSCLGDDYAEPVLKFGAGIRHDLLAESMGARGMHVTVAGGLASAVREALAAGQMTCIELPVPDDELQIATI